MTIAPTMVGAETFTYNLPQQKGVKHITALLFDEKKVVSVTPANIQGEETRFSYTSAPGEPKLSIAFAITPGGELVTNALQSSDEVSKLNRDLPICETRLSLTRENYEQGKLFASLIELRKKRKLHIESRITNILKGDTLKKLQRLEKNFGFQYDTELSTELSRDELLHRLDALSHTIKLYKTHKSAQ